MGKTYSSYQSWRKACLGDSRFERFDGNKDICDCGTVGNWDGEKGVIYPTSKAEPTPQLFKPKQRKGRTPMTALSNIEKSAFHKGEYVGYSGSLVWRIRKHSGSRGNWIARNNISSPQLAATFIEAFTLADLSSKLSTFES